MRTIKNITSNKFNQPSWLNNFISSSFQLSGNDGYVTITI